MPLWTPTVAAENYEKSARGGVTITATGVDTKGTWTSVIASTGRDSYGIWTMTHGMSTTATATAGLLDIGVGPTDPPQIVIPDWNVGWSTLIGAQGSTFPKMQYWPVFIPSGSKIWARLASLISADTCNLSVVLAQDPPMGFPMCDNIIAYGVVTTGSKGTNATSGTAAYGTQVQLTASTSEDHKFWTLGMGGAADTTILANTEAYAQLLIGSGTTGPIGEWIFNSWTTESIGGPFPPFPMYQPVASGTRVDGRILAATTGDTFDLIAYGMS